jgi:hypothetical protein
MTVVFAPFIGQVGKIEPYVSLDEVKFSPTASDIDFTNLVEDGATSAQNEALYNLTLMASGKIDAYVYGHLGTLNATSNTQNGRYRIDRYGRFKVHPSFTPVIAVSAFSWGVSPGTLTALTLSSSNIWIEEESIIALIAGANGTASYAGTGAILSQIAAAPMGEYYVEFTFVNGYPNTFTTSSTASGVTSLPVTDPTGFYPGTTFTIWDGMNTETCQVSSSYVAGSSTLLLTTATAQRHGVGVNVSQMHTNIKQACIHFVVSMIKERGQGGGFEISPIGEVAPAAGGKSKGFSDDELAAYDLLDEFKSISGRM